MLEFYESYTLPSTRHSKYYLFNEAERKMGIGVKLYKILALLVILVHASIEIILSYYLFTIRFENLSLQKDVDRRMVANGIESCQK